jgi:IMP cyclohydrolase
MCRFLVNKDRHEERCGIKGWKPPTETETEILVAIYNKETKIETKIPISTKNKENKLYCPYKPELEDTVTYAICY